MSCAGGRGSRRGPTARSSGRGSSSTPPRGIHQTLRSQSAPGDVPGRRRALAEDRFHDERLDGLCDQARSGRPRRFPPQEVASGQGGRLRAAPLGGRPALAPLGVLTSHRLVVERGYLRGRRPRRSCAGCVRMRSSRGCYRSWIFPTDPDFLAKGVGRCSTSMRAASRVGCSHPGELVICADEKPSIQARARIPTRGLAPGARLTPASASSTTYERRGALTYLSGEPGT